MTKRKAKVTPLPPGTYTMVLERARKVRGKDQIAVTFAMPDGSRIKQVMKP